MNNKNPYQRNLMRLKGFSDGAGSRPMNPECLQRTDLDYQKGYVDGQKAKREYSELSAKELGVQVREIAALPLVHYGSAAT